MRRLLIRIAINGGITAVILGIMGFFYAEMAGVMLESGARKSPLADPAGAADRPPEAVTAEILRGRIPFLMAAGGFAFILLAEVGLYLWRGHPIETKKVPAPAPPDEAEKLLEELLSQVEAAERAKQAAVEPPSDDTDPKRGGGRNDGSQNAP